MENSLLFLYTAFFIAITLNIIAGVIVAAFVIPLQAKEAGVKNGLLLLRKQMLTKGALSLMVIVSTILVLALRMTDPDPLIARYTVSALILIHAMGILGKSYIDYKIYHQQYSQVSKDMHERIEHLEKQDARKEAKHK